MFDFRMLPQVSKRALGEHSIDTLLLFGNTISSAF